MTTDIKERLLKYRMVDPITGCWLWTSTITKRGYGQIKVKGKGYGVHRLSLEVFKSIILTGDEQANHTIECPNKHCFNPDHLYKGTQLDNMADERIKHPPKTKRQKNAEYYARHNQHRKSFGRAF